MTVNSEKTLPCTSGFTGSFSTASSSLRENIGSFIAGIWQIHPFGEGNTRTTAVFLIKYLRSLGYTISNELFASHSWYFRNALVRANYFNREKGCGI